MKRRWYRVVAKTKKGKRISLAHGPLTHAEAVRVLSKTTRRPWRQEMLEEIRGGYRTLHAKKIRKRRFAPRRSR